MFGTSIANSYYTSNTLPSTSNITYTSSTSTINSNYFAIPPSEVVVLKHKAYSSSSYYNIHVVKITSGSFPDNYAVNEINYNSTNIKTLKYGNLYLYKAIAFDTKKMPIWSESMKSMSYNTYSYDNSYSQTFTVSPLYGTLVYTKPGIIVFKSGASGTVLKYFKYANYPAIVCTNGDEYPYHIPLFSTITAGILGNLTTKYLNGYGNIYTFGYTHYSLDEILLEYPKPTVTIISTTYSGTEPLATSIIRVKNTSGSVASAQADFGESGDHWDPGDNIAPFSTYDMRIDGYTGSYTNLHVRLVNNYYSIANLLDSDDTEITLPFSPPTLSAPGISITGFKKTSSDNFSIDTYTFSYTIKNNNSVAVTCSGDYSGTIAANGSYSSGLITSGFNTYSISVTFSADGYKPSSNSGSYTV